MRVAVKAGYGMAADEQKNFSTTARYAAISAQVRTHAEHYPQILDGYK
jgi:hypothetical protein